MCPFRVAKLAPVSRTLAEVWKQVCQWRLSQRIDPTAGTSNMWPWPARASGWFGAAQRRKDEITVFYAGTSACRQWKGLTCMERALTPGMQAESPLSCQPMCAIYSGAMEEVLRPGKVGGVLVDWTYHRAWPALGWWTRSCHS